MKARGAAVPLLLAGLSWTLSAHAGPEDVARLEYSRSERAAAACPDRNALESAVRARLGYSPFFPSARRTVAVELSDVSDGYRAQMRLLDENGIVIGSRELRDSLDHCDELVASLALAISIALDPSAAPKAAPAEPAPAVAPSPEPSPREAEQPAAPSQPAPIAPPHAVPPAPTPAPAPGQRSESQQKSVTRRSDWAARASGFAALGAAPAPALGFRLGASRRFAWFLLAAEFVDQLPSSKTVEHIGGARTSLLSALLAPCVAGAWLASCALLNVGSLHAEGLSILDVAEERRLNVTLGARVECTPTLFGSLQLLANIDVAAALTPVTLRVHGQTVWETPLVSGAAGLGLKLAVP